MMAALWRHSILIRTIVVLMASFFVVSLFTVALTTVVTGERQHQAATERLNQLLDTVERTVSIACFVKDQKLAEEVAQGLRKNKEVLAVSIRADNRDLTHSVLTDTPVARPPGTLRLIRDIRSPFDADTVVGHIQLDANVEAIEQGIHQEVRFVIIQIVGQLALIALAVVVAMLVFIVRPIQAMSDGLHHMDATRGERLAMPKNHTHTEIGRLVDDINELAGSLVATLGQERSLRLQKELDEKKYHSIFENAETGIFLVGGDGALGSWNPAFARLMDIPADAACQGTLDIRQLPWETPARITELARDCLAGNISLSDDLAIRPRDGGRRWLNVMLSPIGEDLAQVVVHDVTEHKEAEAMAKRLAVTDLLTGVTNRLGLEERLRDLLNDPLITRTGGFTLMLVDMDNFRRINEGFGLPAGDSVLKDATARLANCVKSHDTIARLGGDRFALALQSVSGEEDIDRIAGRILQSIRKPFLADGTPIQIQASAGITIFPHDGMAIPHLLRNAELALDRAKAAGGNTHVFFDPALAEAAERRQHLENDLRQAIRKQEFLLYYQPIIDLAANRLVGAEALIRWNHPKQGLVPPDAFIPLAEETGLINEIGLWTLEVACQQLALWRRKGHDRYLSLNVSGRQIPDGLPPTALADAARRHGIDPAGLALEITEGVLLADVDKSIAWLNAVRALGFRIYLDDFGTGYSSLSYLKRFPVDTLKIDKSFVRDMRDDSSDRALIEAVVAMARSLGLEVVAEGVEGGGQLGMLRQMNCHHAQGYYFSRPIPAAEFDSVASRVTDLLNANHPIAA